MSSQWIPGILQFDTVNAPVDVNDASSPAFLDPAEICGFARPALESLRRAVLNPSPESNQNLSGRPLSEEGESVAESGGILAGRRKGLLCNLKGRAAKKGCPQTGEEGCR